MDKYREHKEICEYLNETYKHKNKDYGDSFGESFKRYGKISALTRMSDKFFRIENIFLGHETNVADETVEDTLVDLANYAIMTVIELRRGNDEHSRDRED